MKRRRLSLLIISLLLSCITFMFFGCVGNSDNKNPEDILVDAYGNQEFKISFSIDNLNEPIPDIKYSAKNIPNIPTPVRTGYIFQGWFFDEKYTMPYSNNALLMQMKDVTLFSKWTKEQFLNNGSYDIEYTTSIVDGTLVKGPLVDLYGGFLDFTECVNKYNTFIEKSVDSLALRIEYDTGIVEPFSSPFQAMSLSPSSMNETEIFIENKIDALVSPVKTLFINIGKADLSKPFYFDVTTFNLKDRSLSDEIIADTYATYTVKFDITKIIGFSQEYANPNVQLEKGYYLAKSYLLKEDNGESMAGLFNPVYSYIYSDGKQNYKLIKENVPYTGMVSPLNEKLTNNYHHRLMSFVPMMVYYDFNALETNDIVKSDYYPETYNGGYFRPMEIEFHKDTGKLYNIFDLGNSLKKQYMVQMAVTGFMEVVDGMGYMNMILSIDYDTLIRIPDSECEYKPLEGDAYTYKDEMQYYPGSASDLDKKDLLYDSFIQNGFCTNMDNFFFDSNKHIYDSKITISPKNITNNKKVSDSRYEIKEFEITNTIYDYDVTEGKSLFSDTSFVQKFSFNGSEQYRHSIERRNGKGCKVGEYVRFDDQFKDKVNSTINFKSVDWQVYKMSNGKVDFSQPLNINNPVKRFDSDFAVKYTYKEGIYNRTALIEFVLDKAPEIIKLDDQNFPEIIHWYKDSEYVYVTDHQFLEGQTIRFPQLEYNYMGYRAKFIDYFYDTLGGEAERSINPTRVFGFTSSAGKRKFIDTQSHTDGFTMTNQNISFFYELTNLYGEIKHIEFKYSADSKYLIEVKDSDGNVHVEKAITNDSTGKRYKIKETINNGIIDSFDESMIENYTFNLPNYSKEMILSSYSIYTMDNIYESIPYNNIPSDMIADINSKLFTAPFGYVLLTYTHDNDIVNDMFLYNVTFDGTDDYRSNDYKTFFTTKTYTFKKMNMIGEGGVVVGSSSIGIRKIINGKVVNGYYWNDAYKLTKQEYQYEITFFESGDYLIDYRYSFYNSAFCGNANGATGGTFSQLIHVVNIKDEVTIKFVTDEKHPFKDRTLEKVYHYRLDDEIRTLGSVEFDSKYFAQECKKDVLYAWSESGTLYDQFIDENKEISNFINSFNNNYVVLKAIWDPQITIKFKYINPVTMEESFIYAPPVFLNEYGYYRIDMPELNEEKLPALYHYIGWTGGFLGESINKNTFSMRDIPKFETEKEKEEYFTLYSVVRLEYTVKYTIDYNYSNDFLRWDFVIDGFKIPNIKEKKITAKEGYKFVGWYVEGDTSETIIDLEKYIVTSNVTLVAKFEKVEVAP